MNIDFYFTLIINIDLKKGFSIHLEEISISNCQSQHLNYDCNFQPHF